MFPIIPSNLSDFKALLHLANFDSRGSSREAGLACLKLADWAVVSLTKTVDACHSEPVGLTWSQLLLLPALVVLRPRQLSMEGGLNGRKRMERCVRQRVLVL